MVRASASHLGDLGFIALVESYPKTLKNSIYSIASLLDARHLWEVVKNKPASSLLCPRARHFTGCPTFMWKIGGPDTSEIVTPKRVRTYRPKHSDTIRFLVNGG